MRSRRGSRGGRGGRRAAAVALACVIATGCGGRGPADDPNVVLPTPEAARAAVATVLEAWRGGQWSGAIKTPAAAVELVDTERKADRPLTAFEILGAFEADRFRGFHVKLTVENPREEQVVRYLVVGNDPLWVFRQEDFDRFSHWEHKMDNDDDADPAPKPAINAHATEHKHAPAK